MPTLIDNFNINTDVLYGTGDSIHKAIYVLYKYHGYDPTIPTDYDTIPMGSTYPQGQSFAHKNYKLNVINLYNSAFSKNLFKYDTPDLYDLKQGGSFNEVFNIELTNWVDGVDSLSVREMRNLTDIQNLNTLENQVRYRPSLISYNQALDNSKFSPTANFTGAKNEINRKLLKNAHTSDLEKFQKKAIALNLAKAWIEYQMDQMIQPARYLSQEEVELLKNMLSNKKKWINLVFNAYRGVDKNNKNADAALAALNKAGELLNAQIQKEVRSSNVLMWEGIRKACKFGVDHFTQTGRIHYLLDGIDLNLVLNKEKIDGKMPICSSELRHIFRNWARLKRRILFYRDGEQCDLPWENNIAYWDRKTKYKRTDYQVPLFKSLPLNWNRTLMLRAMHSSSMPVAEHVAPITNDAMVPLFNGPSVNYGNSIVPHPQQRMVASAINVLPKSQALQILGLNPSVFYSDREIRVQYFQLMRQNHPDNGGEEEQCKKIVAAYEALTKKETAQSAILPITYDPFAV